MKNVSWLLPLALAACLADAEPKPTNGHVDPRPEIVDEPDIDEDPILAGMQRWRDSLVGGDFEGFYAATAYYGRASWLFDALRTASLERRGFPRVGELADDMVVEINQWYDVQFNKTRRNQPIDELPTRFLRDPWHKDVLRDHFEKTWQDQALRVRDWGIHLKSAQPNEAWFLANVPGTEADPLIQMVLEEDQWRVRYMIPSGVR